MTNRRFCVFIVLIVASCSYSQNNPLNVERFPDSGLPGTGQGGLSLVNDVDPTFNLTTFSSAAKFASMASKIVGTYVPNVRSRLANDIVKSANSFISLLDAKQKKKLLLELTDPERKQWTNLPAAPNAGGIRLGDLNNDQLKSACDFLGHVLSPQGYEKMRLIMLADDQLLKNGKPRPGFGTENFSIVFFGSPSTTELWSVQFDGHHVGLNVTIKGELLTMAPSFIGTQPVTFQFDGKKIQPLQHEVDCAFILANSLTPDQFKAAVVGKKRGQLKAGPGRDNFIPKATGLSCSKLNKKQKRHLMTLIASWVGNLPKERADARMKEIETEIDDMYFSWQGLRKENSDVSYTLQSPSLWIEFAYQNLGGDPLNHLHTQYRNPKNDYGQNSSAN